MLSVPSPITRTLEKIAPAEPKSPSSANLVNARLELTLEKHMASPKSRSNNQFVVNLGEVKLPDSVADRIDKAIRRAALEVIADLDLDLSEKIDLRLHPEWRGIWIDLERQPIDRFR